KMPWSWKEYFKREREQQTAALRAAAHHFVSGDATTCGGPSHCEICRRSLRATPAQHCKRVREERRLREAAKGGLQRYRVNEKEQSMSQYLPPDPYRSGLERLRAANAKALTSTEEYEARFKAERLATLEAEYRELAATREPPRRLTAA